MPIASLYALYDPRSPGVIRYVGWTSKTPQKRFGDHIREARFHGGNYRLNWMRSLLGDGVSPEMVVVATCEVGEAPALEIALISAFRGRGYKLVNGTDGGDGAPGYAHSEETKAKIGAARRGTRHTEEAKKKMSISHLGVPLPPRSPEHQAALSLARTGKKRSEETILKLRGHGKLTRAQADEIRGRRASGERNVSLAKEFGVAQQTICNIVKGRRQAWPTPSDGE